MGTLLAAIDVVALLRSVRDTLLLWLPIVLMASLVYVLFRVVATMPRTKAKALGPDRGERVSWDDVAGLDEAKEELIEVVEFLRDPERFARLGARCPKGILLHGPPGTGKTLLAQAVASESGAAFFSQSASQFVEMIVGLGASRIRGLFRSARKHQPAIIFIDELDAIGNARSGNAFTREHEQTLNQLLVELDGFDTTSHVIVIAASNRLDALDPALLRPGRFDRQIYVGTPDVTRREEILRVHTRQKPLDPEIDLGLIARQTAGLAGADLENITNEAAIQAARANRSQIEKQDFDWAVERVLAGLQTPRLMSEREKTVVAYHEAGHALVAHLAGRAASLEKVSIVPRGEALGYVLALPDEERFLRSREELLDEVAVALGGRAAEEVVFGRVTTGAASDLERVAHLARVMVCDLGMGETTRTRRLAADDRGLAEATRERRDREQDAICDESYERAVALVRDHLDALSRLAEALLERETLDRHEVRRLLRDVPVASDAAALIGAPVGPA